MTIIEIDKQLGVNWSAHSNDLSIITPPNDDRFWRSACWSPSGLSSLGSCLICGLSTTCDVFVFTPIRNFQTGLWEMISPINLSEELLRFVFQSYSSIIGATEPLDVTPETRWDESQEAGDKRRRFTAGVLRTQATCLAWSPAYLHPTDQTLDSVPDLYDVDFSLLAVGHRRGDLSFWRRTPAGAMEFVSFDPICPSGLTINLLSWSDWTLNPHHEAASHRPIEEYQLSAYLAVANSKGVVYVLKVTQPFRRSGARDAPAHQIQIGTQGIYQDALNQSTITCFKWISSSGDTVRSHWKKQDGSRLFF